MLNLANLESQDDDAVWRSFMRVAINNQLPIWIAIAAGSFTTLATVLVLFGSQIQRMRLPTFFLLPLELLSSLSMATAFGATLSLALKYPNSLFNLGISSELASFAMLLPLSRAYAITTGAGMFFGLTSTISSLVRTIHRVRDSKACSFEPMTSTLGMSHGYEVPAIRDSMAHSAVQDEEKGLVYAAADMGKRDLEQSGERTISWPLAVAKKLEAANVRPHRPWSEMPKM